jgi:hypothetical protein
LTFEGIDYHKHKDFRKLCVTPNNYQTFFGDINSFSEKHLNITKADKEQGSVKTLT